MHHESKTSKYISPWTALVVCLLFGSLLGCDQQRYKPAKWRPAARNSANSSDTNSANAANAAGAVNYGTLPGRAGNVWGTLPNRNGGTLPSRGGTLPFRGGNRSWSTLPMGGGIGTLPQRGLGGTLPRYGTLPQRRVWESALPERRWQKVPPRGIGTLPRRGMGTLPGRRAYEVNARPANSRAWETLPSRSELRAAELGHQAGLSDGNPLRK